MDYKSSGVDIDAGNKAVDLIKNKVKSTFNSSVLNSIGGFAGMYEIPEGYKQPVLVSCTDGVGTKVKLAIEANDNSKIGIDLVAMCVNDLICCGAKPLYFLDYIACHKTVPKEMDEIISGIVDGCKQSDCALIGGEMAEMNDLYKSGDFDLAGFSVGIVEKSEIIDGQQIKDGQFVYGLTSSGFHSNGYSLVRKVLDSNSKERLVSNEDALIPTKIYVKKVLDLIDKNPIKGIAHITGGGFEENLERIIPKNIDIDISPWDVPSIFKNLQKMGNITDDEMYRVFNMGIGMVIISESEIDDTELIFLGKTKSGSGKVSIQKQ